jgi:hypothetical protein
LEDGWDTRSGFGLIRADLAVEYLKRGNDDDLTPDLHDPNDVLDDSEVDYDYFDFSYEDLMYPPGNSYSPLPC